MKRSLVVPLLTLSLLDCAVAQNNILKNGGFEQGLMCYSEYSNPGEAFQFLLSTDSHSGKYSAEITCSGTPCTRAQLVSNFIPAPANQSYTLSMYSKCAVGAQALAYIPGMVNGDVGLSLACNGAWSFNQVSFKTGPAAGYLFYYLFGYTSPLQVDDVVLTYGDGTVPQSTTLHSGVRNVSTSGQNVMVDGAPYLALGFYDVGYYDLPLVAATGANTINGYEQNNSADCFNTGQKSYLDQAYELGLNFLPDSSTTARTQTAAVFPTVAQTFAPHLANIGWYLADEPDLIELPPDYVPPATFLAESAALKTETTLPVIADFQHAFYGSVSQIAPYNGSSDIWMSEPYGDDFSVINHAVNLFDSIQTRPIWLAQDLLDNTSLIVPKAYWAIISGATGILYYTWGEFLASPGGLAAAEQVFSELKGLNKAIFGDKMDALVSAPAGIAAMSRFDPGTGTAYILSANSASQTLQGNFLVQGLAAGQQIAVLYENRTITAGAGSFSDTFAGVSRHVYAIQSTRGGGGGGHRLDGLHRVDDGRDRQPRLEDPGLQHRDRGCEQRRDYRTDANPNRGDRLYSHHCAGDFPRCARQRSAGGKRVRRCNHKLHRLRQYFEVHNAANGGGQRRSKQRHYCPQQPANVDTGRRNVYEYSICRSGNAVVDGCGVFPFGVVPADVDSFGRCRRSAWLDRRLGVYDPERR